MDEVTKAKVRQITEMVSIYQSSMDGTDVESMKLVKMDLKNKEQELTAIQKSLDEELSRLYKNSSEIDPEINQLQREIQEIDNVLEDISDLLASAEQGNFEEKEEVLEIKSEQFKYEEEEEIDEVEMIGDSEEEAEEIDEIEYIEDAEEEDEEIDEVEIIEDAEEEDEEIDEVEIIEDAEEEDEEIDEVEIIEDAEEEDEEIDEVEYENTEVLLTEPSEKYLKEAETIVESRKQNTVDPEQAVENGAKTAEDLLDKLKKVVLVNEVQKHIQVS